MTPFGGRYVGLAASDRLGVGWSVNLGLVDEAWDVPEVAITQALSPAMAAAHDPQLLLISTAGDASSTLLQRYRDAATDGRGSTMIAEWSARADADWRDERVWREASPAWSSQRLTFLREQVELVPEGKFRSQYLNQASLAIDGWIRPSAWQACRSPLAPAGRPAVAACEVSLDGGTHAVIGSWLIEGRIVIRAYSFPDSRDVDAWLAEQRPKRVLAGASYASRLDYPAEKVGVRELAAGMPTAANFIAGGRLAHDGDPRLEIPILACREVRTRSGTQSLASGDGRALHFARALVWAVSASARPERAAPRIYVAS